MPFSPCRVVIERISAVIDGEVSAVDRLRFHAHLALCPPCKRYYAQLVAVRALGSEPSEEDLPQDFAAVMSFVLDAVEPPDSRPRQSG